MPHFLIELRPSRADLATSATPEERALIAAHFAKLERLCKEGKVLLVGRSEDASIGIAVLEVADRAEAERIVAEDPALSHGLMTSRLHEFRLGLYAPRDG